MSAGWGSDANGFAPSYALVGARTQLVYSRGALVPLVVVAQQFTADVVTVGNQLASIPIADQVTVGVPAGHEQVDVVTNGAPSNATPQTAPVLSAYVLPIHLDLPIADDDVMTVDQGTTQAPTVSAAGIPNGTGSEGLVLQLIGLGGGPAIQASAIWEADCQRVRL